MVKLKPEKVKKSLRAILLNLRQRKFELLLNENLDCQQGNVMDVDRCLERIGYRGSTDPTLHTIRNLQMAFLRTVPFENLDIHLGRKIELASGSIYEKIVSRKRGGFCYECNILFFDLLNSLDFEVEYLSARMVKGNWKSGLVHLSNGSDPTLKALAKQELAPPKDAAEELAHSPEELR